jgi:hypothetical protein
MPSWHSVLQEISARGSNFDILRREYLRKLHRQTGRNIIVYYSGWLQKQNTPGVEVNDADKNGLMTAIHGLDRKKGLDLVLHTPGGQTAATESIVDYLHSMFGTNVRAIVPQLAMSAGTMIACSCREILMGAHSSLGPIDPQFGSIPAHGIIEEFQRACEEVKADPSRIPLWQPIIAKYSPTLIGQCEKAIKWSISMTKEWLLRGMLHGEADAVERADRILSELGSHAITLSHARHLSYTRCRDIGLRVSRLEADQRLQEAVLSVHHAAMHTLSSTGAFKIIENHKGVAYIQIAQPQIVMAGPAMQPSGTPPAGEAPAAPQPAKAAHPADQAAVPAEAIGG